MPSFQSPAAFVCPGSLFCILYYEGRSINKLQNSIISVIFKYEKFKYTFCTEFYAEYQL